MIHQTKTKTNFTMSNQNSTPRYGQKPAFLGYITAQCPEMMYYHDMPIKLINDGRVVIEPRLECARQIINRCIEDFVKTYGPEEYNKRYIYLSVKNLYQEPGKSFNRPGYHCDGFMTKDINYVWSDVNPTVLNDGGFKLDMDKDVSLSQMTAQARPENDFDYGNNSLVRLDQYNVHKVAERGIKGLRFFIKVTFSTEKYDLEGNSHNYLLDYNWEMRSRDILNRQTGSQLKK